MSIQTDSYFNKDGKLNDNGIALCAEAVVLGKMGQLPERLRKAAEEDPETRREIAALATLLDKQELKSDSHPFFDAGHQARVSTFPTLKAVAVILMTVMLGTLIAYFSGQVDPNDSDPVREDYSENFEPNVFFESLTGQTTRSDELEILEPELDAEKQNGMNFRWAAEQDENFSLIILSNRGDEIIRADSLHDSFRLEQDLVPGLYYWRLETGDELMYVGRFTVRRSGER
ncbi:hypothetical protein DYD21_00080 [Rhodohalobacter sp. SW132]|uniref:hypothetical protein n=1 Tax=Rhodohalobacter sp. SW132 TaxID=2293433 RepID=UPI000E2414BB|nr:hypothetical protein [Rhodohalobacter sp. SW132]REL38392.1 hypothetical protein DYD21_00080 [Rhodohalobacter sp. SW132]